MHVAGRHCVKKAVKKILTKKATAAAAPQAEIPASVFVAMTDDLIKATNEISPFGTTLTPKERRRILKANNKSLAFVKRTAEYSEREPQYLSSFFTTDELQGCTANIINLLAVEVQIGQLAQLVTSTRMQNGNKSFEAALNYYDNVKQAMERNVPGAEAIYKELSARFPHRKKKKPAPTVETPSVETTKTRKGEARKAA